MSKIQKADLKARRIAIFVAALGIPCGFLAISAYLSYEPGLQRWLELNIDFLLEHLHLVFLFGLILVSPVLALAAYLLVLGARIVRARRYPPPGYAVSRDTLILEGATAVRRGRIIQVVCAFIILTSLSIPVVLLYLFQSLAQLK